MINEDSEDFIKSADEWVPIPGSLEAITRLNHYGYRVVVVSNQSGLGRGLFNIDDLNGIHQKMHKELARLGGQIEAIFFCPHRPEDHCHCRKPSTGLFDEISARLHTSLLGVSAVGDSARDILAAREAGASPVLVLTGKGTSTYATRKVELGDVPVFANLGEYVDFLLPS